MGKEVPLETLLSATPAAYLQVRVLAFDEFTGSRKFFESEKLFPNDIRMGKFEGLEVRG